MYLPPHFKAKDLAHAAHIVRANPFASLISNDDAGLPFVSHIPLHLVENASLEGDKTDPNWTILGHVAKPNPHWRYLAARPMAVLTFMGPQAYMSPSVYPDLVRVPTWSYLAVHCVVRATLIEEPEAKDRLLKQLIGEHEPAYAVQWMGLGEEYQHKMLAGIVGFSLAVERMECKIKVNQHRPEAHAAMHAVYAQGNDNERALADWMVKLGLVNLNNEAVL
jgi:transcriptional regulator